MYDEMNGLQVLWYLLTNWEEGKGLWFIIAIAMVALCLSIISDRYGNDVKVKPEDWHPY
jgi:hypothetical protein|tara:strand:+ start:231 stop:407 length:177 start_codon:yes stop_codon:yes gene_type:complete